MDVAVQKTTIEIDSVREISVLDGLTTQLVIISVIYALVWLTIMGFEALLYNPAGGIGNTIFGIIKSFNFILGIAYALAYKQILKMLEKKGKNVGFMTNNYLLSNISSMAFNYMIAGAVLTITVDFLVDYGWLLMVITTVGGIATLFFVRFLCQRVYPKYKDEYFVALYGMLTGVASTGIALLKGLDRQLETPVAEDLVMGSGTAIMMALPLFGILMLPGIAYGTPSQGVVDYIVLFGCLAYTIIMVVILLLRARHKPINEEKKV
jgi:ESS family glutamate:Na+ symporter